MKNNVYTVTQINRYIRGVLSDDLVLSALSVRGEVSNVKYHPTGHLYFILKDAGSQIPCVMFSGSRAAGLTFRMRDGDTVVVSGTVDVFERDGRYQLYAKSIRREGAGELYERFLRLKKELEETGIFDAMYKKPIPKYAMTIGIVTADSGAAIQDIRQIARRRNPYVQLILCPAAVQGEHAAKSIVRALRKLDSIHPDVIICGRGGGSIEDLWAFNEEIVVRAIFDCETPVISAVGHETDVTLSDLAADLRAPTPSAAAEIAVFDAARYRTAVSDMTARFGTAMARSVRTARTRCSAEQKTWLMRRPDRRIRDQRMMLAAAEDRMRGVMEERLRNGRDRAENIRNILDRLITEKIRDSKERLRIFAGRFDGLSPLKRLSAGFVYAQDERGQTLRSVTQTAIGEKLTVWCADGRIVSSVTEKG